MNGFHTAHLDFYKMVASWFGKDTWVEDIWYSNRRI